MKVISIDAETDGLWGDPFATAAIVYKNEQESAKFLARLPSSAVKNEWVKENVLPTVDFDPTHSNLKSMLKDFALFYMKHKKDAAILWHMGHVVEAYLFRLLVQEQLIGEWDAPYCPIEVSEHLRQAGEKPDSVDAYVKKYGIEVSDYGSTHNPLYDCEAAARAFFNIKNKQ